VIGHAVTSVTFDSMVTILIMRLEKKKVEGFETK